MTRPSMLQAPFPYFGGKRAIAPVIWQALGEVGVYVEPFFGSGSILLARPTAPHVETVNDLNAFLSNFWRALQQDPDGVATWADSPVSELDLHARHRWLVAQEAFIERMRQDPDYYDVKLAGWWVWGICCWIGGHWCASATAHVKRIPVIAGSTYGHGLHQRRPHLRHHGQGLHALHDTTPRIDVPHQRTYLPQVQGDQVRHGVIGATAMWDWLRQLADRLRRVRICCGDWRRVLTPVVLDGSGYTGIVLDPPYDVLQRDNSIYSTDTDCAAAVAAWAREHGDLPQYRIVLCGYIGEHTMPASWQQIHWEANGGYGNQGTGRGAANKKRECLWLSPHCVTVTQQLSLFTGEEHEDPSLETLPSAQKYYPEVPADDDV